MLRLLLQFWKMWRRPHRRRDVRDDERLFSSHRKKKHLVVVVMVVGGTSSLISAAVVNYVDRYVLQYAICANVKPRVNEQLDHHLTIIAYVLAHIIIFMLKHRTESIQNASLPKMLNHSAT